MVVIEKLEQLATRENLAEHEIERERAQLAKQTWRHKLFDIFLSLIIRIAFVLEIAFFYYYLIALTSNFLYLLVSCGIVIIICDLAYIIYFRHGKEYSW